MNTAGVFGRSFYPVISTACVW